MCGATRRKTEIEGMLFGVEYQKARDAGPNVRGEAEGFLRQVPVQPSTQPNLTRNPTHTQPN